MDGDQVSMARISQGSVAPTIIRSPEAEAYLVGKQLSKEVAHQAAVLAAQASRPIDDLRAPADYRASMVQVLVKRALVALRDGRHRDDWPADPPMLWGGGDGRFPVWQDHVSGP